ncbi:MAG: hypothetical protein V3W41_00375 [Planctomycetota bacterium]
MEVISGDQDSVQLDYEPLRPWVLFLSFDLGWFRLKTSFIEVAGTGGLLSAGQLVAQGTFDALKHTTLTFDYPLDSFFHNLNASLQNLGVIPASASSDSQK